MPGEKSLYYGNGHANLGIAACIGDIRNFLTQVRVQASFSDTLEAVEPRLQVGDEVGNRFQSDMETNQRTVVCYS